VIVNFLGGRRGAMLNLASRIVLRLLVPYQELAAHRNPTRQTRPQLPAATTLVSVLYRIKL